MTHDAPGLEADAKVDVVAPQRALADTPPLLDALRVTASEITSPLGSEMVSPAIESVLSETPVPSHPVHLEKEPRRPLGESTPINDDLLKLVPQSATMFVAGSFDPAKLLEILRGLKPEASAEIERRNEDLSRERY